jgi:hypothetical protein
LPLHWCCSSEVTADIYLTIEEELEKNVFCMNNARACYSCILFEQRGLVSRSRGWLLEECFLTWTSVNSSLVWFLCDASGCCRESTRLIKIYLPLGKYICILCPIPAAPSPYPSHALPSMHFLLCTSFYALPSMHFLLCTSFYALPSMHFLLCTTTYTTHLLKQNRLPAPAKPFENFPIST